MSAFPPGDQSPSSTRLGWRPRERFSESSPPPPTGTDPQVRGGSRRDAGLPGSHCASGPDRSSLDPGPSCRRELQIAQPFRPRRPIVPDLTHLGGYRRRPGWGARGKLPTAQKAGSVTARPAKANPATSPPALRSGSRQGRFTLLARERRPRRLLRPLRRKELITNGCLGVVAESGGRKRNPLRDPQQVKTQHPPA